MPLHDQVLEDSANRVSRHLLGFPALMRRAALLEGPTHRERRVWVLPTTSELGGGSLPRGALGPLRLHL